MFVRFDTSVPIGKGVCEHVAIIPNRCECGNSVSNGRFDASFELPFRGLEWDGDVLLLNQLEDVPCDDLEVGFPRELAGV